MAQSRPFGVTNDQSFGAGIVSMTSTTQIFLWDCVNFVFSIHLCGGLFEPWTSITGTISMKRTPHKVLRSLMRVFGWDCVDDLNYACFWWGLVSISFSPSTILEIIKYLNHNARYNVYKEWWYEWWGKVRLDRWGSSQKMTAMHHRASLGVEELYGT